MDISLRSLKLRQIDTALEPFRSLRTVHAPAKGWLSEIRRALAMSAAQLGHRLGITRQAVSSLEYAEADGSITLKSLHRAADALQCDLVYALVPRESLETLLDRQAQTVALARVNRASHTMALERQDVSEHEREAQVQDLAKRLRAQWPRNLWDATDS